MVQVATEAAPASADEDHRDAAHARRLDIDERSAVLVVIAQDTVVPLPTPQAHSQIAHTELDLFGDDGISRDARNAEDRCISIVALNYLGQVTTLKLIREIA